MKVLKWADTRLQDSQNQPKTQNSSSIKNCTYQDDNVKIIFRHNFQLIPEYPGHFLQSERKYNRQMLSNQQTNMGQQRHVKQFYQMLARGQVSQINSGSILPQKRKHSENYKISRSPKIKSRFEPLSPVKGMTAGHTMSPGVVKMPMGANGNVDELDEDERAHHAPIQQVIHQQNNRALGHRDKLNDFQLIVRKLEEDQKYDDDRYWVTPYSDDESEDDINLLFINDIETLQE